MSIGETGNWALVQIEEYDTEKKYIRALTIPEGKPITIGKNKKINYDWFKKLSDEKSNTYAPPKSIISLSGLFQPYKDRDFYVANWATAVCKNHQKFDTYVTPIKVNNRIQKSKPKGNQPGRSFIDANVADPGYTEVRSVQDVEKAVLQAIDPNNNPFGLSGSRGFMIRIVNFNYKSPHSNSFSFNGKLNGKAEDILNYHKNAEARDGRNINAFNTAMNAVKAAFKQDNMTVQVVGFTKTLVNDFRDQETAKKIVSTPNYTIEANEPNHEVGKKPRKYNAWSLAVFTVEKENSNNRIIYQQMPLSDKKPDSSFSAFHGLHKDESFPYPVRIQPVAPAAEITPEANQKDKPQPAAEAVNTPPIAETKPEEKAKADPIAPAPESSSTDDSTTNENAPGLNARPEGEQPMANGPQWPLYIKNHSNHMGQVTTFRLYGQGKALTEYQDRIRNAVPNLVPFRVRGENAVSFPIDTRGKVETALYDLLGTPPISVNVLTGNRIAIVGNLNIDGIAKEIEERFKKYNPVFDAENLGYALSREAAPEVNKWIESLSPTLSNAKEATNEKESGSNLTSSFLARAAAGELDNEAEQAGDKPKNDIPSEQPSNKETEAAQPNPSQKKPTEPKKSTLTFDQWQKKRFGDGNPVDRIYNMMMFCDAEIEQVARSAGIDWSETRSSIPAPMPNSDNIFINGKDQVYPINPNHKASVAVSIFAKSKSGKHNGQSLEWFTIKFFNMKSANARPGDKHGNNVFEAYKYLEEEYQKEKETGEINESLDIDEEKQKQREKDRVERERLAEAKQQRQAEKEIKNRASWARAIPTMPKEDGKFDYLIEKKVPNLANLVDLRKGKDNRGSYIVYPLYDVSGNFWGAQQIYGKDQANDPETGLPYQTNKHFILGTKKHHDATGLPLGTHAVVGTITKDKPIVFSEGLADAGSICMAKGLPVVNCLDADNLVATIVLFREVFPEHDFIVASDDDTAKPHVGNAGMRAALISSFRTGARITSPKLMGEKDFNDIHVKHGLSAVESTFDQSFMEPVTDRLQMWQLVVTHSGPDNVRSIYTQALTELLISNEYGNDIGTIHLRLLDGIRDAAPQDLLDVIEGTEETKGIDVKQIEKQVSRQKSKMESERALAEEASQKENAEIINQNNQPEYTSVKVVTAPVTIEKGNNPSTGRPRLIIKDSTGLYGETIDNALRKCMGKGFLPYNTSSQCWFAPANLERLLQSYLHEITGKPQLYLSHHTQKKNLRVIRGDFSDPELIQTVSDLIKPFSGKYLSSQYGIVLPEDVQVPFIEQRLKSYLSDKPIQLEYSDDKKPSQEKIDHISTLAMSLDIAPFEVSKTNTKLIVDKDYEFINADDLAFSALYCHLEKKWGLNNNNKHQLLTRFIEFIENKGAIGASMSEQEITRLSEIKELITASQDLATKDENEVELNADAVNLVSAELALPETTVRELLSMDLEELQSRDLQAPKDINYPPPHPELNLNSAKVLRYGTESAISHLIEIDKNSIVIEGNRSSFENSEVTKRYKQWYSEGANLPPIELIRDTKSSTDDKYIALSSERGIAAFESDSDVIRAWVTIPDIEIHELITLYNEKVISLESEVSAEEGTIESEPESLAEVEVGQASLNRLNNLSDDIELLVRKGYSFDEVNEIYIKSSGTPYTVANTGLFDTSLMMSDIHTVKKNNLRFSHNLESVESPAGIYDRIYDIVSKERLLELETFAAEYYAEKGHTTQRHFSDYLMGRRELSSGITSPYVFDGAGDPKWVKEDLINHTNFPRLNAFYDSFMESMDNGAESGSGLIIVDEEGLEIEVDPLSGMATEYEADINIENLDSQAVIIQLNHNLVEKEIESEEEQESAAVKEFFTTTFCQISDTKGMSLVSGVDLNQDDAKSTLSRVENSFSSLQSVLQSDLALMPENECLTMASAIGPQSAVCLSKINLNGKPLYLILNVLKDDNSDHGFSLEHSGVFAERNDGIAAFNILYEGNKELFYPGGKPPEEKNTKVDLATFFKEAAKQGQPANDVFELIKTELNIEIPDSQISVLQSQYMKLKAGFDEERKNSSVSFKTKRRSELLQPDNQRLDKIISIVETLVETKATYDDFVSEAFTPGGEYVTQTPYFDPDGNTVDKDAFRKDTKAAGYISTSDFYESYFVKTHGHKSYEYSLAHTEMFLPNDYTPGSPLRPNFSAFSKLILEGSESLTSPDGLPDFKAYLSSDNSVRAIHPIVSVDLARTEPKDLVENYSADSILLLADIHGLSITDDKDVNGIAQRLISVVYTQELLADYKNSEILELSPEDIDEFLLNLDLPMSGRHSERVDRLTNYLEDQRRISALRIAEYSYIAGCISMERDGKALTDENTRDIRAIINGDDEFSEIIDKTVRRTSRNLIRREVEEAQRVLFSANSESQVNGSDEIASLIFTGTKAPGISGYSGTSAPDREDAYPYTYMIKSGLSSDDVTLPRLITYHAKRGNNFISTPAPISNEFLYLNGFIPVSIDSIKATMAPYKDWLHDNGSLTTFAVDGTMEVIRQLKNGQYEASTHKNGRVQSIRKGESAEELLIESSNFGTFGDNEVGVEDYVKGLQLNSDIYRVFSSFNEFDEPSIKKQYVEILKGYEGEISSISKLCKDLNLNEDLEILTKTNSLITQYISTRISEASLRGEDADFDEGILELAEKLSPLISLDSSPDINNDQSIPLSELSPTEAESEYNKIVSGADDVHIEYKDALDAHFTVKSPKEKQEINFLLASGEFSSLGEYVYNNVLEIAAEKGSEAALINKQLLKEKRNSVTSEIDDPSIELNLSNTISPETVKSIRKWLKLYETSNDESIRDCIDQLEDIHSCNSFDVAKWCSDLDETTDICQTLDDNGNTSWRVETADGYKGPIFSSPQECVSSLMLSQAMLNQVSDAEYEQELLFGLGDESNDSICFNQGENIAWLDSKGNIAYGVIAVDHNDFDENPLAVLTKDASGKDLVKNLDIQKGVSLISPNDTTLLNDFTGNLNQIESKLTKLSNHYSELEGPDNYENLVISLVMLEQTRKLSAIFNEEGANPVTVSGSQLLSIANLKEENSLTKFAEENFGKELIANNHKIPVDQEADQQEELTHVAPAPGF